MTLSVETYKNMQKQWYEHASSISRYFTENDADHVVGSWEDHDRWPDYDRFLMKYVDQSFRDKFALDFACGPGRNIMKYSHLFRRLDGADIAEGNLANARLNFERHGMAIPNLYATSGADCGAAPDNSYDFVFSTIAMQHICVHESRYGILSDMYRILRKLGRISIQMGFGYSPSKARYFDNPYDAAATNSAYDCMIENTDDVEADLSRIGFTNFEYWIRPTGPGDSHPHWIFFTAIK